MIQSLPDNKYKRFNGQNKLRKREKLCDCILRSAV